MTEARRGPDVRETKLDRLLDAALRQLAGGEGPLDMRHRVLARLAEPPRAVVSRGAMLAAAVAIALAGATGVLLRKPGDHSRATSAARRDLPPSAYPLSPPPAPAGSPTPVRSTPLSAPQAPRLVAGPQAPDLLGPDHLEADGGEIEPIEVSPLAVSPLEVQRWAIAPLRIEPMQIEPLAEPQP